MLNEQRKGEIALAYLRMKVRNEPILLNPEEMKRKINNTAKSLNIEPKEAMRFVEELFREASEEMFAKIWEGKW